MLGPCANARMSTNLKQMGGKPITLGQGYSTIAWIPEAQGSWALPLLHERITSFETPLEKACDPTAASVPPTDRTHSLSGR